MNRKYHRWTSLEIEQVSRYVDSNDHPTSLYDLETLAAKMDLPLGSVRGAVVREMQRRNKYRDNP